MNSLQIFPSISMDLSVLIEAKDINIINLLSEFFAAKIRVVYDSGFRKDIRHISFNKGTIGCLDQFDIVINEGYFSEKVGVSDHETEKRINIGNFCELIQNKITGFINVILSDEYNINDDFLVQHLVRAIYEDILYNKGYLLYHAAAFSIQGRIYLILGDKGDGKTTLLVQALKLLNASFISNDRVFGAAQSGRLHIIGREQRVRIGVQTIADLGQAGSGIVNSRSSTQDHQGKYFCDDLGKKLGGGLINEGIVSDIIIVNNTGRNTFSGISSINAINKSQLDNVEGSKLNRLITNTVRAPKYTFLGNLDDVRLHYAPGFQDYPYFLSKLGQN